LKEWECVKVGHHKDVGKTVEEWQKNGWRLHTYVCAQAGIGEIINHYLLFERGEPRARAQLEALRLLHRQRSRESVLQSPESL
jgi:hypothetical protein